MKRILITGAAGFLGRRLTRALIQANIMGAGNGPDGTMAELCLADCVPFEPPSAAGLAVSTRHGDLADPAFVDALAADGFDSLFHLASLLTLHAEQDPSQAYATNVEALRRLVDGAKGCPKIIFTSSIAVFGGALPPIVDDDVAPAPTTTYGTHKAITELLIADYSRHGRIDGRSLRLPIVLTRPGLPQQAVSDLVAGIVREPLNGRDVVAPLGPDTAVPVISAGAAVAALIRLHDLPAADLPPTRAFNLPALTVTVAQIADAVRRRGATGTVRYAPDPQIQAIVDGWPARVVSSRATRLGLAPDADIDALIADHLGHKEDDRARNTDA